MGNLVPFKFDKIRNKYDRISSNIIRFDQQDMIRFDGKYVISYDMMVNNQIFNIIYGNAGWKRSSVV